MSEITAERRVAPVSVKNKVGLVVAGILGLADLAGILYSTPPGEQGPPFVVLAVDAVLGLLTVAAVVYTWRTGNRIAARVVAVTRILSALSALPAFFVGGVPAGLVVLGAASVILAAVSVALVLAKPQAR